MLTEKELPIDIMIADGNPLVLSAMSDVFEVMTAFLWWQPAVHQKAFWR